NVLNYSMHGSRVYINVVKNVLYGVLTIKNISAFPLDITPDQLTERFVRGDKSRTTEGSGLGLSIAQSLTKLQGGRFKVEIDGDLFKVTVEIPLEMVSGKPLKKYD
ncbi:MAG: ATP-binding protein, partial [Clostridia bacterium]